MTKIRFEKYYKANRIIFAALVFVMIVSCNFITTQAATFSPRLSASAVDNLYVSRRNLSAGELSGALLQIKDGDTVVETWTSDGTIHSIEASLTVDKTYTLHEETAPEGYLKAADINFSVDVNGKVSTTAEVETDTASGREVIVMYDSSEESEYTYLTVRKNVVLSYDGGEVPIFLNTGTFYVALYKDSDLTMMIGEPQAITFSNETSSSTTFTGIEPGFTYYVAEVDWNEDGSWTPRVTDMEMIESDEGADAYTPIYGEFDGEEGFCPTGMDYDEVYAEKGENYAEFNNVCVSFPDEWPTPIPEPKSLDAVTVDDIDDQVYTGSNITPTVTVKDGDHTLVPGTNYTVSYSNNINAADKSAANAPLVTITGKGRYTGTKTTNFTISKAAARTIENVTERQAYTLTGVSASVAGKMPDDAGAVTYTAGIAARTGSVAVSDFVVDASGTVTAVLSGGAPGDTVTLPVTISSTNYADSTVNVVITLTATAMGDAGVNISGAPASPKTYGDTDFVLTGSVTDAGTGTGTWTWISSDSTVLQITPNGANATVKILKAGSATVTVNYESGTTAGTKTTDTITVNTKTLSIAANNQNIYVGGLVPDLSLPVLDTHYTVTGLVGEDVLTTPPTLTYQKNGCQVTPDNTMAGTYDIAASGASVGDNYTISYIDGKLTISDKDTQTISASDVTATYGDTDKSIRASVTEPATGGGVISYAVKSGSENYIEVNISTGALTIKAVPADGKAYVTVTAAGIDAYKETAKDVTININKANAVAATVTANDRTYDGTEKPLVTVTGEATGGTMYYALGTDTTTAPADNLYTISIPAKTDIGTYYVWYKVIGDSNHNDCDPKCVCVTISAAGSPDNHNPENQNTNNQNADKKDPDNQNPGKKDPNNQDPGKKDPNNGGNNQGGGNRKDKKTEKITISKRPSSVKAKAKKNKVTVSWKKIKKNKAGKKLLKQINSIQIQYSTDKAFKQNVKTKTVGKKKTKVTLKVQKKTTYYIRVRYKGSNGFSTWSKVKKVKTKK